MGTSAINHALHVEDKDARLLERHFAPLTADDLQGLGAWEIAVRPSANGAQGAVVTGTSLRCPRPTSEPRVWAAASRERYGVAHGVVEASLTERLQVPTRPERLRPGVASDGGLGSRRRLAYRSAQPPAWLRR